MGRSVWMFASIFGGIGVLCAAIGFGMMIHSANFASSAEQTQGVVVEMARSNDSDGVSYTPVVAFTDRNGVRREFVSSLSTSWRAYDEGERIEVLYDPVDPDRAAINSSTERYLLPGIFAGIGSLFTLIAGGFIVWRVRRIQTVAKLFHHGQRIEATVIDCQRDGSMKINGRSPYRVMAQGTHPATGMLASFKSDPIWLDLSDELVGQTVPVLVDRSDADAHYVDLTEWVHESEFA